MAAMIGPMIGNHSSTPAISASTRVNSPNSLKPMRVRIVRPIDGGQEDAAPRRSWPRTQRPPTPARMASMFSASGAPAGRQRAVDRSGQALAVLQDEEEPDRDDDQAEQEAGRAQERLRWPVPGCRAARSPKADPAPPIDSSIASRSSAGSGSDWYQASRCLCQSLTEALELRQVADQVARLRGDGRHRERDEAARPDRPPAA